MGGKALMVVFFLALALLAAPQAGAYLYLDIEESSRVVYLGDDAVYNLDVMNQRYLIDRVGITVSGGPEEWVIDVPDKVLIEGKGEKSIPVTFFPSGDKTGTFRYAVTVKSYFSGTQATETVTLNVMRPLDIEEFTASREDGSITIGLIMNSKDKRTADLDFVISDKSGKAVHEFSLSETVSGRTVIKKSVSLPPGMAAGDYNIMVSLRGAPVTRDYMFTILPEHRVTESVVKTSSALYDDFEIVITNEGNIREPQYVTYKTVPNNDWVTGFITEPDECFIRNGDKTCKFVFSDITPGESVTLSYRLDYWSVYATYILVLIIVFTAVLFSMRRATAPIITKRQIRKPDGMHHVILEIRNPYFHNLTNTIARDWVSPLANVLHHEISMLKPLVRRSEAGTELIWKLGDIKPKETRIITYPIKAVVQGSLKMPRAYIRFNRPNGKLKRIFSRSIVIEA